MDSDYRSCMLSLFYLACTTPQTSSEQQAVVFSRAPKSGQPFAARQMAQAMWKTTSHETYLKKIRNMVADHKRRIPSKQSGRPRLIIMGSSSSGGGTPGNNMKFWPEILSMKLDKVSVYSLAEGGATTWHMNKVMQQLNIQAEICIVYMGFNDRQEKSPLQSIAELEQGLTPQGAGFVPWVYPEEQKENLEAIAQRCKKMLLVKEYALDQLPKGSPYLSVFESVTAAKVYDPSALFQGQPQESVMMDKIHPTPYGHTLLADAIINEIKPWLP